MPGESFLFQSLKMSSIAGLEEEAFLLMEDFFLMRAFSFVFLAVLGGFFFGVFFGVFFGAFMGPTPCDEGVAPRRSLGIASIRVWRCMGPSGKSRRFCIGL